MREQITFYKDQYEFYKELKSKRLLIAFMEYMFEDIEPQWLNWIEKVAFNSLKIRMDNQKKKSYAWTQSSWWWRHRNTSSELDHENNTSNNTKTTDWTTQATTEKQEDKDKDKEIKENNKRKYLDYVYLSDVEYEKISNRYGERVLKDYIERVDNWIWEKPNSKDRTNRNHYRTILNRIRNAWIKEIPKKQENESWIYDLPF